MSGPDDRIRAGLKRLVQPADPSGAFDRVVRRRRRYRMRRRAGSALLSIAVVGGAIGGFLGLRGVFEPSVDPGSGLGPTPGPTASATPAPEDELVYWEICGDAPFPDCHWVANVLDRAGFSPRHNTRSALVGKKRGVPPVTMWATGSSLEDPTEPAPTDGENCRPPYRPLARIEGIQVCTDGVRHVWRAQDHLVWVTAGQTMGDVLIGAEELQPLVRASLSVEAREPGEQDPSTEIIEAGTYTYGFCDGPCDSHLMISGREIEVIHARGCTPVASTGVDEESCSPQSPVARGRLTDEGRFRLQILAGDLGKRFDPREAILQTHGECSACTDGVDTWVQLERGGISSVHRYGSYPRRSIPPAFRAVDLFVKRLIEAGRTCTSNDLVRIDPDCVVPA